MKKIFYTLFSFFFPISSPNRRGLGGALFFLLLLTSCDKVPMNGDLDGMWQLMTVQTGQNVRNVRDDRAYMSIQLHLTQWYQGGNTLYSHFVHEGDSIRFYDFAHDSLHRSKADDNEWVTEEDMLNGAMDAWGIHNLDARYRVRQLDGEALILEKADTTLFFRKF